MEKYIIRIAYPLGVIAACIAALLRGLNIVGFSSFITRGNKVGYNSFLDGATILFLISIASAGYSWVKSQNP